MLEHEARNVSHSQNSVLTCYIRQGKIFQFIAAHASKLPIETSGEPQATVECSWIRVGNTYALYYIDVLERQFKTYRNLQTIFHQHSRDDWWKIGGSVHQYSACTSGRYVESSVA